MVSSRLLRALGQIGYEKLAYDAGISPINPDDYHGSFNEMLAKVAHDLSIRSAVRQSNRDTRQLGLVALCHYRTL